MSDASPPPPALLPRRMKHIVVVGPQSLSLDSSQPSLRLPVEAYRGEVTLSLPSDAVTLNDLKWWRNDQELPGQSSPHLRLADLTLDDSDLYHATGTGADGTGVRSQSALVVVYPGHTLANQSVRGFVRPDHPLVAGFVVGRSAGPVRSKRYLIRVIGPSLTKFGVEAPLTAPVLAFSRRDKDCFALLQTDAALVNACAVAVGAFALAPDTEEFAAVADLPPGAYAVTVSAPVESVGGEVLVEVYETRA